MREGAREGSDERGRPGRGVMREGGQGGKR